MDRRTMNRLRPGLRLSSKVSQKGDGSSVKTCGSNIGSQQATPSACLVVEGVGRTPPGCHYRPQYARCCSPSPGYTGNSDCIRRRHGSGWQWLRQSLARPSGNVTGFTNLQPTITGKYLSILRELNSQLSRVALMYNPESFPRGAASYTPSFVEAAKEFHVTPIANEVHSPTDIETAMADLGTVPGSGLIVVAGTSQRSTVN